MFTGGLCCELYVWVEGMKVGEILLGMLCLVDDKGVIHVLKPDPGRIGGGADGSGFEIHINRLATKRLFGRPIAAPCTCL